MPIFTAAIAAASTFIGGLFTVAGFTTFALKVAVGAGLSFLAQALAGKPQSPESAAFGVQGTLQADGDVPRSFMLGYGTTAGSLVYANTWKTLANGTPNAFFTSVMALSDLPVGELREVWVNGELVTLDTENEVGRGIPVVEYRVGGVDHLWVKFYDGTQTEADSFLVNNVASAERPYGVDRIGYGVAYVICTARVNSELFTGFPQYKFAVYGAPLYDISKDTTAGGSGTQRWDNPSTWGGDGDFLPAVQIYNILRGIFYDGDWLYGAQQNGVGNLPAAAWIAAIASNRLAVAAPGATTEPQFRAGGQITVANPAADTIEALLSTCHGRLAEIGGVYKLKCGNPGTTSVFSFSDANILSTEGQTFAPFFGLAESVNGITARYPEPAEGWSVKVAPPRYSDTFEAEDGGRRLLADVPLDYAPYKHQVQRLMKMALQEARRARRHTLVLPPDAQVLEPLDIIDWTSVRNGYEAKKFRVDGVVDKGNLDVMLDVTEINPDDYDWDPDADYDPPEFGPVIRPLPAAQAIVDWAAEGWIIEDEDGNPRRPAILLSWDGTVDDVKAVAFAVRLKATAETVHRGRTDEVAAAAIIISQGLLPNTEYETRGRYVPTGNNRSTSWSSWLTVTTPDVRLGFSDIGNEIKEAVRRATLEAERSTREAISRVSAVIAQLTAMDDANKDKAGREIRRSASSVTALFREEIEVAIGSDSAFARALTQLQATVGDILADARAEFVVGVTPAGAVASYELRTVAESASAGIRVVAFDSGNGSAVGQVWIDADKFYIGKTGVNNTFRPFFVVSGGQVFIDGSLLASGSVKGVHIAGDTITGDKIRANTIEGAHIKAGTLTANKIVSNSIIQQVADSKTSQSVASSGNYVTLLTITATFKAGTLMLFGGFNVPDRGSNFMSCRMTVDSVEVVEMIDPINRNDGLGDTNVWEYRVNHVGPIAAGSHTIRLQAATTGTAATASKINLTGLGLYATG